MTKTTHTVRKILLPILLFVMLLSLLGCDVSEPKSTPVPTQKVTPSPVVTVTPLIQSEPPFDVIETVNPILEYTPTDPAILTVDDTNATVEQDFIVTVSLDNSASWGWSTFEFYISYDPNMLRINSINLTDYTADMIFEARVDKTPEAACCAALSANSFVDVGGNLIEIHCTALKAGSTSISLYNELMYRIVTLADTNQIDSRPIDLVAKPGTVSISE